MTVTYKQLQSEFGFQSPGFLVDENGNFNVANLNATGALKIDGNVVLTPTGLASSVVNSSLTSVGTLTGLTVDSANDVNITSATAFNLTTPTITLDSSSLSVSATGAIIITSGTTGSLDNVDVGNTSPGQGTFTTLTATTDLYVGTQNIKALAAALAVALS